MIWYIFSVQNVGGWVGYVSKESKRVASQIGKGTMAWLFGRLFISKCISAQLPYLNLFMNLIHGLNIVKISEAKKLGLF